MIWKIESLAIPNYNIVEYIPKISLVDKEDIIKESTIITLGIDYDINRVSTRNARKSELGPYKNTILREIIMSHKMGKTSGTKEDLVNTILNFHENKSR